MAPIISISNNNEPAKLCAPKNRGVQQALSTNCIISQAQAFA